MKISDLRNIDPQRITNIVFDWGGVITEIDFDVTINAFNRLGYNGFTKQAGNYPHSAIMEKFEVGSVEPEAIIEYMSSKIKQTVSAEQIWQAWNALLLDTPANHIEILKTLGTKFRLLLLSNTNIIHTTHYRKYLLDKFNIDFYSLFNEVYLSYELGLRKPQSEIFHHVLKTSKIDGGETLFIDDLESNIDAADRCGFIALHHKKNEPLKSVFEPWLD